MREKRPQSITLEAETRHNGISDQFTVHVCDADTDEELYRTAYYDQSEKAMRAASLWVYAHSGGTL